MKDRSILSAAAILAIASVLVLASTSIMTNTPKVSATDPSIFTATLSGDEEVPPVNTTAKGTMRFSQPHLNDISYGIQVFGIDKVTGARMHTITVRKDTNGPVIVTLFKAQNETGTGPLNGQFIGGIHN